MTSELAAEPRPQLPPPRWGQTRGFAAWSLFFFLTFGPYGTPKSMEVGTPCFVIPSVSRPASVSGI
jgi:hypothetical protein